MLTFSFGNPFPLYVLLDSSMVKTSAPQKIIPSIPEKEWSEAEIGILARWFKSIRIIEQSRLYNPGVS
jgi:hypothetical protein